MAHLHYLTIQDVLWVHLQVTNKVETYDYARLEEAVFYQYALGDSTGLLPQASRFLSGFGRMHPFEAGNEATAFLSCAAFLRLNGKVLNVDSAGATGLIEAAKAGRIALDPLGILGDAPKGEHLEPRKAPFGWCLTHATAMAFRQLIHTCQQWVGTTQHGYPSLSQILLQRFPVALVPA